MFEKPSTKYPQQFLARFGRRALLRLFGSAIALPAALRVTQARAADIAPTDDVWAGPFTSRRVWGYVDRHSVLPSQTFDLMLSAAPGAGSLRGHIEFYRVVGDANGARPTWTSGEIEIGEQPVNRTAATVGPNWPVSLAAIDPRTWQPGYYAADFVEQSTGLRNTRVACIIVSNPERSGRILLKLGVNTYQAYNPWGGHSLYPVGDDDRTGGFMVSFDRPTPASFFEYDAYLASWLEALGQRNGFSIDYAANFDVHRDPSMLQGYGLVVCGAHDEYWSKEEFDAFEERISVRGQNTIFFGANAAYWQVRYGDLNRPADDRDHGRQLITYKSLRDPIVRRETKLDRLLLATARFRDAARRPETMLIGVGYQDWFPFAESGEPRVPYHVETIDPELFEGTGYKKGDVAADVVGYEWDNRDPEGDGRRLWDKDRSRIAQLPAGQIKVLFSGAPKGATGKTGRAEAVIFRSAAGARVFSSGSIRWAWGLGKPGFVQPAFQRFNENLIRSFH